MATITIDKEHRSKNINLVETTKKRIVLCDTLCTIGQQKLKLDNRYMGYYRKVPTYTISQRGEIIEHFDSNYYSDYLNVDIFDRENIYIELENVGWLEPDIGTGQYYNWEDRHYSGRVKESLWRSKNFWATYSRKQTVAVCDLLDYLFNKHEGINRVFTADNVKMADVSEVQGVVCLGNYAKTYLSPNPTFDFEFVNKEIVKIEDDE